MMMRPTWLGVRVGLLSTWSDSLHWPDSHYRNDKIHRKLCWRPHDHTLKGSDGIVLGQTVIVLASLICPNMFHFYTGVGSLVLPTALHMAISFIMIFIFRKITVRKRRLPFSIFQPSASECLHYPPGEIGSTHKRDHVVDVFPSSCFGLDLDYWAKSRAMW